MQTSKAQQLYPGGKTAKNYNFQVYRDPFATKKERATYVGHELFGDIYMQFIGKDPRHFDNTSNPELSNQIISRENESETNSKE